MLVSRFTLARRRILGQSSDVDLHSLRRSFVTAADTAINRSGRLESGMLARLIGHKQGTLGLDLYSDWARLGHPKMSGDLAAKLAILRNVMEDIAALGMDPTVLKALEDTAGNRPPVVRVAPAFRRRKPPGN